MMHAISDSDATSLAPSSPISSPKSRPVLYYVQSPSRDSHDDGDKSSSMQATPVYNSSPMESPSHPSYGRHSRESSASRFSGTFGRKIIRNKRHKGWPECNVIREEGSYNEFDYDDDNVSRRCQIFGGLVAFVFLFSVFCLIIWGASRRFAPEVMVKSLSVNNFYFGEGSDNTGVPTKMLTVNCSLKLHVYNPATFFGIHVSSSPVYLIYSQIPVANGQLKKYYQPRKSRRTVSLMVQGTKVPLYGAGASLAVSDTKGGVPLSIEFGIYTRGNVVGKLVKSRHRKRITCPVVIDSGNTKPIKFNKGSCTYG